MVLGNVAVAPNLALWIWTVAAVALVVMVSYFVARRRGRNRTVALTPTLGGGMLVAGLTVLAGVPGLVLGILATAMLLGWRLRRGPSRGAVALIAIAALIVRRLLNLGRRVRLSMAAVMR